MALITLIISKCYTSGPDATANWEASVQRPSKRLRHEDSECLLERGDSIVHIPMNVAHRGPAVLLACPLSARSRRSGVYFLA